MRSTLFLAGAAALASTALAADCAAQNIVDACVAGYQTRIEACQKNGNDWICLCDVYTDVYTCYNNCPDSADRAPVENTKISYCTAAEPLRAAASASMASVASVAKTATTAAPTSASASATGSSTATGSAASASASAFATGAASALTTPAGAAVIALFAAAGLF
ncbi:uncharacterized protein M421DRAFT_7267 [Didymella exigua CBS 183.55]|uniref:GPI anchored serine-threonine rich protein n=1 Tax=Didymella exigua CBS 183.55 TaxID=1150837 RepID=A0A6A5RKE9_9PLEO|nr:uncharacterized protein M421DRAFT_7267 [Didymella exigua CBS 183.55]KAF1926037.1 hypothetical protein M421DRAFT_7267 [Didymella exigua CBS 183.55]